MSTTPGADLRRFETEQQGREWLASTGLDPQKFEIRQIPADYVLPAATAQAPQAPVQSVPQEGPNTEYEILQGSNQGDHRVLYRFVANSRDEARQAFRDWLTSQGITHPGGYGFRVAGAQ